MIQFGGGVLKGKRKIVSAILSVLCAAVLFCGFFATNNTRTAEAYTSGSVPTENNVGDIVLSDYASRSDGLVFNGNALNDIFGKLVASTTTSATTTTADLSAAKTAVSNSDSIVVGNGTRTGTTDTTVVNGVSTQPKSINFSTMQTNLGGAPITLTFGGYDWTVVYATTNTAASADGNTKAGDLVVTLWMNDCVTGSKRIPYTAVDTPASTYPSSMYSTSYLRVAALNAGGDNGEFAAGAGGTTTFATSTTARGGADGTVALADRKSNQFANFTLSNNVLGTSGNNPSFTEFLTAPKYVAYQEKENSAWSGVFSYIAVNEAWGTPDVTLGGWWNSNFAGFESKPAYYEWSNDYLWLPSITETGMTNTSNAFMPSLWGFTHGDNIFKATIPSGCSTNYYWSRTGDYNTAKSVASLSKDGMFGWQFPFTNSTVCGVRPALHLNLSKAWENAAIELEVPEKVTKEYNGETQYFSKDNESWYDPAVFENINYGLVTYTDPATNNIATPKDVGSYKVTFELKSSKYTWKDGDKTNRKREVILDITKKTLSVEFRIDTTTQMPTLALAPGESPYPQDSASQGDFELVIHYYATDGTDMGTDSSVLKKGVQYQAVAEFGGKRGTNYQPDFTSPLTFTNPATRVGASFVPSTQVYNGQTRNFMLILTGGAPVTATLKEDYGEDVKKETNTRFSAVNAGKYEVVLSLDNKDDYVWASTGRTDDITVYFEVTPLTKQLTILTYNSTITGGNTTTASIEMPPLLSGTLRVVVGAYYMGTCFENLCAIDLSTAPTHSQVFTLETASLASNLTYELGIDYDDPDDVNAKNYKIEFVQTYSLTVKEPSLTGGVNWRLMSDGAVIGNQADPAESNSATYGSKITYSGKYYYFTINATGIGYSGVDTDYNENGFTDGYKTVKASAPSVALPSVQVKDAGTYITYVHLKNDEGEAIYSIQYTIDKAMFDLSGVRWLPKDGKIAFSAKMSIVIDPETLPEGLNVQDYDGSHSATEVGQSGQAIVIFGVSDPNNYVIPVSSDSTSYIFTENDGLSDFEWAKDWEVVPAEIPVNWTVGTVTASGNKKVNAKVLAGGYDAYLDYVYYESDGRGNVAEGATPISELEIVEGTVKYYVAEVSIKANFVGRYVLEEGKSIRSGVFEIGHTLTAVQLAARKTVYVYWGNAVTFQFKVTQGTITDDAFEITYYKGTLRQVNPPKDVGSYTAQISLKSEYANDYYIDGITSFEYKIERAVIAIDWNNGTKPPALKITQDQKACISYEYIDSAGNTLGFSGLTKGAYKVRAVIKSASTKNYIFDNDLTYTDWVEFTVTGSDTLTDPDDSNLYDPPSDPNVTKILVTIYPDGNTSAKFSNSENLDPSVYFNIRYYSLDEGRYLGAGEVPNVVGGRYRVEVTLKDAYVNKYELTGNSFTFTLSENADDITPPPDDGTGDNPSDGTIISYLPLILSGISLILIVVFLVLTMNNLSAAKEARAKAKKLATMSYSFAPAGLLGIVLGLSETNWWIIAGVRMGLARIMGIVAFMSKGKKRKALLALEEEQERIAEEKELAREEKEMAREAERDRRDNEMRMMFASMQQGAYGQQQVYDDSHIQNLIASTVSALLPAMQQQMALPPAQDPNVYASQPDYAARAENEELRAQLAKQQELLNQLLQNQQAQQATINEALYEDPEPVDDISWLGENDEMISLEESYGALSDEGKRAYYEIGSYIMNKPRTSQNDGKYAVLFKYRGRTIFKLAIKDDAPVLYYPLNGGRGEVRVMDAPSLETAKSMIDRTVMSFDSQM